MRWTSVSGYLSNYRGTCKDSTGITRPRGRPCSVKHLRKKLLDFWEREEIIRFLRKRRVFEYFQSLGYKIKRFQLIIAVKDDYASL